MPRPGPPDEELKLAERPLPFWWSNAGCDDPPAFKRVEISARNAQGEPLLVRRRTHLVNSVTLTRVLRHIATILPPRLWKLLDADDGGRQLDAADLLLRPLVHKEEGREEVAVCMLAKSGRVAGFSGGKGDYLRIMLGTDELGRRVDERVHALICWLRHGPPPTRNSVGGQTIAVAAHTCGGHRCNRSRDCISPCHLAWDTRGHNSSTYYHEARERSYARGAQQPS